MLIIKICVLLLLFTHLIILNKANENNEKHLQFSITTEKEIKIFLDAIEELIKYLKTIIFDEYFLNRIEKRIIKAKNCLIPIKKYNDKQKCFLIKSEAMYKNQNEKKFIETIFKIKSDIRSWLNRFLSHKIFIPSYEKRNDYENNNKNLFPSSEKLIDLYETIIDDLITKIYVMPDFMQDSMIQEMKITNIFIEVIKNEVNKEKELSRLFDSYINRYKPNKFSTFYSPLDLLKDSKDFANKDLLISLPAFHQACRNKLIFFNENHYTFDALVTRLELVISNRRIFRFNESINRVIIDIFDIINNMNKNKSKNFDDFAQKNKTMALSDIFYGNGVDTILKDFAYKDVIINILENYLMKKLNFNNTATNCTIKDLEYMFKNLDIQKCSPMIYVRQETTSSCIDKKYCKYLKCSKKYKYLSMTEDLSMMKKVDYSFRIRNHILFSLLNKNELIYNSFSSLLSLLIKDTIRYGTYYQNKIIQKIPNKHC